MTACISRPEIMSSAVVFWKSAILSVSAWIVVIVIVVSSDEIFQGQRQHSTALSLSLFEYRCSVSVRLFDA